MEGREPMAGIMSPPSSFSVILQKGLAAQLGGSSSAIPLSPSGLHAPAPIRTTSSMAAHTTGQPPYEMGSGIPATQPIPVSMHMGTNIVVMEPAVKKKRGRPRKYGPDGSIALALVSHSSAAASGPASSSQKKGRVRPPGFGKKQQLAALGTAGAGFTPHVITIAAGEDVAMKVMSFSQKGPRAICILSANGAISNVTLRQPATSGGMVTYEGRFEILSLSGSFLPTENAGIISRTGGLSVSLAGPDGRVLGGGVAGLLMAASPVQVVVGSFVSSVKKSQSKAANAEGLVSSFQGVNPNATTPLVRPPMHETVVGTRAESPSISINAHQPHDHSSMVSSFSSMPWLVSEAMPDMMRNTDINISLPGG